MTSYRTERRLLLVAQADEHTPATFVKRVHELLPELHQAGMAAAIHAYLTSGLNEERL